MVGYCTTAFRLDGGFGAALVVPFPATPAKVVMLSAGSVNVNELSLTETLACWEKFKLAEVIHGVTELLVNPARENSCETLEALRLITTIAKLPLDVCL